MNKIPEKQIIAGPCALESREHLREVIKVLKDLDIKMIRASLWKPRTRPGWEGLGTQGLPILLEETIPHGLIPATEILSAEQAQAIVDELKHYGKEARMIVWLGARNQNHLEQKRIAKILTEGPSGTTLMFKNQVWDDENHWLGIYEHLLEAGFPSERLMICHRGFCPGKLPNPEGYRNLPDFEMAMRIKQKTSIPMILDPSHIGGTPDNILKIIKSGLNYSFDGYIIEVHHDPSKAKTDIKQQLTLDQFQELLGLINRKKEKAA